jgi:hypothetical protein
MIRHLLGNTLWTLVNARAWLRYRRARRDPRRAQERILLDFLRRNAGTEYGRRHGYAKIRSVREFLEAVPVVTYDDLEQWVEAIRDGRQNVLTAEPVLMMEKTSGSAGAAKYVPYTASLRREFQNAVGAWMFDLFTARPSLLTGAQYWSITPVARAKEYTPGGLPVGFDDDTEYLGRLERLVLRWAMAVPGEVCRVPDIEENRRVTLRHLLACRGLRFLSVWNPSFLTILMSGLPAGTKPLDCWPGLRLISCWTSAASARFVPELRRLFPGVEIQGKGLLATEGVVSFPLVGKAAPVPALTSHFLEFLGDDGRPRLVDELEVGARYRVVITTGGGLARYTLGDVVEVAAPGAIEFVGRADGVSDVCGEKLSEAFAGRVLEEVTARCHSDGFIMLAPEWGDPPRYLLFVEAGADPEMAAEVERRLRASVHYDYCRRLGQLAPVEAVAVPGAAERYLRACATLGQPVGGVKAASLRSEFGWRERLAAPSREGGRKEVAHA